MAKRSLSSITVDYDLDSAIPYLVARTGSRMGGAFSKALKPYGLSLNEWRVCASLGRYPYQRLSDLVVHACVDMSALSRIVDRLIAQGLVSRERSDDDGRAVRLALTERGADLVREIVPLAQLYENVAVKGFTKADMNMLRSLLNQLYDSAAQLEGGPGAS
ncbi:MarR family winged helix-turn-helix transcriptional regulator [Burkholderia cepacia]|uniref:MarR family winged helix-turn-helix transcriptional regulator n=1 Tax=Burkholderia cepacia TaxID=292 RepID=UPI002AB79236|nr:MarR family transcriptional regulator [Burkholderia cepacia]